MLVDTYRFGPLEVPESKLITMERPILGFEGLRGYCLIEIEELEPFLWLQSTDNSTVAFLVVNPLVFFPDYRIVVNPKEIAELNVDRVEDVETYVVVTITDDPSEMSVNLQGPILINNQSRLAKQLVLVNSQYRVNHQLLDSIEARELEAVAEPAELAL